MAHENHPNLEQAQATLRAFLERMVAESRHGQHGERPDDAGGFSAARMDSKDRADIMEGILRRTESVLNMPPDELGARFDALNDFLQMVVADDLGLLPPDVFGPIGAFIENEFGVSAARPPEDERIFELEVAYLMQATSLDEVTIRRKLHEAIEKFQSAHGKKPDAAELRDIAQSLADPLRIGPLRE